MGKDIYTSFLLDGDKEQIAHFINHHINTQHTLDDCNIWDCESYLLEKKCELYINNIDNIISTGGRIIIYKNKNEFRLESKNGYCIDAIKLLCNYYDKLTVKINFYDEDFDLYFGWAMIKNTIVLGHDIIYLQDLNNNSNINSNNNNNIKNTIIFDSNNKDIIISFIIDKLTNNILHTNEMNMQINNNSIEFNTYNKPYYIYIDEIIKKYKNINFSLIYRDTNTYYGYIVVENSKILIDEFINLEEDKLNGFIDYFKYKNYEEYILQTDPEFLP